MRVHRHLQWRRDPDGTAYRARRSFPAGPPNATVLLAGPGSVSHLDGEGRDDELLERLTVRLVASGAQVLQCDMPARDRNIPASAADERIRAGRLRRLLDGYRHLMTGPLSLVGFSLGGQALLRLLESGSPSRADRVVLIGTVVETDAFLTSRVPLIELVYGSFDLVGYLADESDDTLPPAVFEPALYADWSARHLIGTHSPAVRVHVLDGLGHTLHPCGPGPARDPLPALTSLVGITS
ncbi:alpha/beta hydrolase [Streptomyces sp. NPDC002776]